MVELKLEPLENVLNNDYYVSVRVGEVQKLSRMNAGRAYKFASNTIGERKFGKIEIFKKVGNASVGIVPDGEDQEVKVDLEDNSKVKFKVTLNADSDKPTGVPIEDKSARQPSEKVAQAKAYLNEHNLEMRLSEAMQAVLREKPVDPAAFVSEKLAKNAGMVRPMTAPAASGATLELAPPPTPAAPAAPPPTPAAEAPAAVAEPVAVVEKTAVPEDEAVQAPQPAEAPEPAKDPEPAKAPEAETEAALLEKAFNTFDKNDNGAISIVEFSKMLVKAEGEEIPFSKVYQFFKRADNDENGSMDLKEFSELAKALKAGQVEGLGEIDVIALRTASA